MDRGGFVRFAQWTFIELKTNATNIVTHSKCQDHSLLMLECNSTFRVCDLYKPDSYM